MIAAPIRSDLELPPALSKALSLYLLFAIGLKGGASLAGEGYLSLLTAIPAAVLLRMSTRFDRSSAAALAAHYG